ncbi:MAG: TldD/PmbA family protein [Deltaproteobacteria bacterium]|nr:TldD/PmbA family protein [Deltaproteobacteria bacterium]
MMGDDSLFNLLEQGLAEAKKIGVSNILLSAMAKEQRGVEVFERELKSVQVSDEVKLSVWLSMGEAWGASTCEGLNLTSLKQAIEQAKLACEFSDPDPNYSLAPSIQLEEHHFIDESIFKTSMQDLEKEALKMEALALAFDPKIKNVSELSWGHTKKTRYLLNSQGLKHAETSGLRHIGLSVLAEGKDGRVVNAYEGESIRHLKDFDSQAWVGQVAAEAVRRIEPKTIKSGDYEIILEAAPAAQLLRSFVPAFGGDFLYKGLSKLEKKLEQKIASEIVTLSQSPIQGLVPVVLDGEGMPAQDLDLIKEGMFKNFYHNLYTAKKAGVKTTGNAAFASGQAPALSPLNLAWQGKTMPEEELLKKVNQALYIKELHGAMASPISGDFSYGALGYWVEDGQIQYPIADFTVAGNFFEMLLNIKGMGQKLRYQSTHVTGSYGGRDLWVKGLKVSA